MSSRSILVMHEEWETSIWMAAKNQNLKSPWSFTAGWCLEALVTYKFHLLGLSVSCSHNVYPHTHLFWDLITQKLARNPESWCPGTASKRLRIIDCMPNLRQKVFKRNTLKVYEKIVILVSQPKVFAQYAWLHHTLFEHLAYEASCLKLRLHQE